MATEDAERSPQSPDEAATHARSASPSPRTCVERRARSSPSDSNDQASECSRRMRAATPGFTPASINIR